MDAHSQSAARHPASPSTKSHESASKLVLSAAMHAALMAQLGGYTLEQLEQDCRLLMRRTAAAAIELGKRLIMIKEIVGHGQWLPTVERIGINSRQAARFMRATIRLGELGDCPALVKAADSPAKLIELLALNDEELQAIEAGEACHGVSVSSLPAMTVKQLRATLRKNTAESAANPSKTTNSHTALKEGDRIRSTLAGRTGIVVRTYDDGSASVCWDEGEPQAEGLGHERMPRCMLELVEVAESAAAPLPPSASPILGASPATKPTSHLSSADDPEHYPAVYSLLPGEFKGMPISLICHEGRVWLIAEEIAAVLGDSPKAVAEIEEIISYHFAGQGFPEGSCTKVRLASTTLVMRLLDQRAIRYLGVTMDGDIALDLADWISADHMPVGETAAHMPMAVAPEEPQRADYLDQLRALHYELYDAQELIAAQATAVWKMSEAIEGNSEIRRIADLAKIAVNLTSQFEGLLDKHDRLLTSLSERLFKKPGADDTLPESVWLALIKEMSAERAVWGNEDMWRLSQHANSLRAYAAQVPEAGEALRYVKSFVQAHGAYLCDHEDSGTVAWAWSKGHSPQERRKAQMAH